MTYSNTTGEIVSCLFCNIVAGTEPATVVFENDKYVVFKNIRPVSDTAHYLVSPKHHMQNLSSLSGPSGVQTITEMVEVSNESKSSDVLLSDRQLLRDFILCTKSYNTVQRCDVWVGPIYFFLMKSCCHVCRYHYCCLSCCHHYHRRILSFALQIGKESLGSMAPRAQYSFHVPPFNR